MHLNAPLSLLCTFYCQLNSFADKTPPFLFSVLFNLAVRRRGGGGGERGEEKGGEDKEEVVEEEKEEEGEEKQEKEKWRRLGSVSQPGVRGSPGVCSDFTGGTWNSMRN